MKYKINYTFKGKAFTVVEADNKEEARYLFYSGGLEEEEPQVSAFKVVSVEEN